MCSTFFVTPLKPLIFTLLCSRLLASQKDKERAEALSVDDYLVKSQVVIGDVVERVRYHFRAINSLLSRLK